MLADANEILVMSNVQYLYYLSLFEICMSIIYEA